MKNQNDLIISIVAIVLALIIAGVCFGTKREPVAPAAPESVNLAPPALPQGDVVMAAGLPSSGGGGGAAGGGRGGPMGMAGGPMGMSGGGMGRPAGAPGKGGGPMMGGPSAMGGK